MNKRILIPFAVAFAIIFGYFMGQFISSNKQISQNVNTGIISEILGGISSTYVDNIDVDSLTQEAAITLIQKLDPHSSYISPDDLKAVNDDMKGSFTGIGVQFSIQSDTVYVVDVITGGPSEKAGLLDGDRIVMVDDSLFVGKSINNEKVMKTLRGEKGSEVKLGIVRRGTKEMLTFKIVRGAVPVHSVDIAYMVTPKIGYISINKFGATTYREFMDGLAKLKHQKMQGVIVDLRGNAGGYLEAAANMINEFMKKGELIVYVQGKSYPRSDFNANGSGSFQTLPLVVLIDEFSGSASEIFAGAIQDNDRGRIIGRRSFGKGLVQNEIPLSNGGAYRLTVARYYTPSGRFIQKPYKKGDDSFEYETEVYNRFLHGEDVNQDSIHLNDSLIYKTKSGRTVYGGGGIMPDIFVPRDTTGYTQYYKTLTNKNIIYRFALDYTEKNRNKLTSIKDWEAMYNYLLSQGIYKQLEIFAQKEEVKGSVQEIAKSKSVIEKQVMALIARNAIGEAGFYPIYLKDDATIDKAIEELSK